MSHECKEKQGGGTGGIMVVPNGATNRRPVDLIVSTRLAGTVTISVNFCPYCGEDFRRK